MVGDMTIEIRQSPSPLVSIIIPSAASIDLLFACLRSIERLSPRDIPFETIVIQNEAAPDVEAHVRNTVLGISLINSSVNLGVAGSGNLGRAMARGRYLIMLHDDAEIESGWMEALVETAEARPEAGAIGSKVLFPDGRLQYAGAILWSDGSTSAPWAGERPPATAFDRLRAVDYCGSSSLLVRTAAWDAAGGLDENLYPVYFVDVDLAMALRALNYVFLYQPRSRIRHHQSASTDPLFRSFVAQRNRGRFERKWKQALERQESPHVGSQEAVDRAIARAEALAASRPSEIRAQRLDTRLEFDRTEQQNRIVKQQWELQEAYKAWLAQQKATGS